MYIRKLQLHTSRQLRQQSKRKSLPFDKIPKNGKFLLARTKKANLMSLQKIVNSLQLNFGQQNKLSQSTGTQAIAQPIKINIPVKSNLFQFPTGRRLTPRNSQNSKNTLQVKYDELMDKIHNQLPFSKPTPMIGIFNKIKTCQRENIAARKQRKSPKKQQIDPYTKRKYRHVKMDSVNYWNNPDPIKVNRVMNISKPCQINTMAFSYRSMKKERQEISSSLTKTARPFSSCEFKDIQAGRTKRYARNPSEKGLLNELKPWQEIPDQVELNF